MVTDRQVRKLMKLIIRGAPLGRAALQAGMSETTARKYRRAGQLPSECRPERRWRTRPDPFAAVWEEVRALLEVNPGLQAKTLFGELQRRYPGRFQVVELPPIRPEHIEYYLGVRHCPTCGRRTWGALP